MFFNYSIMKFTPSINMNPGRIFGRTFQAIDQAGISDYLSTTVILYQIYIFMCLYFFFKFHNITKQINRELSVIKQGPINRKQYLL